MATRPTESTTRRDASLRVERRLIRSGHVCIGGIDEVGRGAWAGPLVVGAVLVDSTTKRPPKGTTDSKLLTSEARRELAPKLQTWCVAWALGEVSADEIDAIGMTRALRLGAWRALGSLVRRPQAVILDGIYDFITPPSELQPPIDGRGELDADSGLCSEPQPHVVTMPKADSTCGAVAAASILAKVARDDAMIALSEHFPAYGFDRHKGYGTAEHESAITSIGLSPHHRRSWRFVERLCDDKAEPSELDAGAAGESPAELHEMRLEQAELGDPALLVERGDPK